MAHTYTYVNLNNIITEIAETDLNFAGNWSSGSTYFFGDVTLFNTTRYLALVANQGKQPPITLVRDNSWSALVLAVTGSLAGTAADAAAALALANQAYGLATYAVSIAGTAGGGSGDATYAYVVARAALETAWKGTTIGLQAQAVASAALTTAWAGTDAAAAAQAQANQANAVATDALVTSWTGTSNGAAAMAVATDALSTAWTGTAVARAAGAVATDALTTAWTGTSNGAAAMAVATAALSTAWVGTNAAAAAQAQANQANAVATDALTTAWTGTGNGAEARRFASGAYDLAVIGTNAASAAQATANEAVAELATVNDLLFHGQTGTFSTYVAQVPNWKSDLPVTIQNGVVSVIGPSRYQYEDFKLAPVGLTGTALGDLSQGFTWNGSGMIQSPYAPYDTGVQPNDPISRLVMDEFSGQGTLGRHVLALNTVNTGSGWAAPWVVGDSWAFMGTELFEDYGNVGTDSGASSGTFIPSSGTGGMGFTGTTFAGSFWYAP